MRTHRHTCRRHARCWRIADRGRVAGARRASLLLEVLISLVILVGVLGVLSSQLVNGMKMVAHGEEQTRASQLGDRILALVELDPATQQRVFLDQNTDGEFGDEMPGWFWRVMVEPTEIAGLGQVTIQVLHQSDAAKQDDIQAAKVVRQLHLLKADPGKVDLAADFGFDEDKIAEIMGQIPIPGLDPSAIDPHQLVQLDPLQLLAMLPALMPLLQQFQGGAGQLPGGLGDLAGMLGGDGPGGGRMPGVDLAGMMGGVAGLQGPGADIVQGSMRDFIKQQLGDRIGEEELDKALGGMGGGRGSRGGNGAGDIPKPPGPGGQDAGPGMSRDALRSFLRGALGDRVTEAELEQALDAYDQSHGGGGGRGG